MSEAQEVRMLFPVVLGSLGRIALNGDCRMLRRFLYLLRLRLDRLSSCLFAWKIKLYLIWGSIGEDNYLVSRTANLNGNTRISLLKFRDFKRPFLFLRCWHRQQVVKASIERMIFFCQMLSSMGRQGHVLAAARHLVERWILSILTQSIGWFVEL